MGNGRELKYSLRIAQQHEIERLARLEANPSQQVTDRILPPGQLLSYLKRTKHVREEERLGVGVIIHVRSTDCLRSLF